LVYNSKTCCRACHKKLKNADQVIYTDEGMEATVLIDQAESNPQIRQIHQKAATYHDPINLA